MKKYAVEQTDKITLQKLYATKQFAEIERRRAAGELDELLGKPPIEDLPDVGQQWTRKQVRDARARGDFTAITDAYANGLLRDLLSGKAA